MCFVVSDVSHFIFQSSCYQHQIAQASLFEMREETFRAKTDIKAGLLPLKVGTNNNSVQCVCYVTFIKIYINKIMVKL